VINGNDLTVIDTITVGRRPLGVKVDDIHDVIYVANFFGEETLGSSGALSIINGETHTVIQTIPTAGITDLAVLVGVETDFLDDAIDRIYVNDGRIIDCNITDLTVPTPCQVHSDDSDFGGRLAINDTRTLLFGADRYDNSVTVFDVATNTKKADIFTGVSAHGLAVDPQIGNTYVSDYSTRGRLFVIDREGKFTAIDLSTLGVAFGVPGQVEVDETNGRIYIISPNAGLSISPFIALDRETRELGGILEPDEWTFGWPGTLGIDEGRNLLYLSASSNRLLVFDGAKFFENTRVNDALVANIVIGREDGTELAGGVAVDANGHILVVDRFFQAIVGVLQTSRPYPTRLMPNDT
jgi:DNA-binding beta-propeller fold protein YncE